MSLRNHLLHACLRTVLIVCTAHKKFWLSTVCQEVVAIVAPLGTHRQSQSNHAMHPRIPAACFHAYCRSKGKACEENGPFELRIQPVERRADVIFLSASVVVSAFAASRAAKIKPQHRQSECLKCLHGLKNDLVVEGAAAQRVWMADKRTERS